EEPSLRHRHQPRGRHRSAGAVARATGLAAPTGAASLLNGGPPFGGVGMAAELSALEHEGTFRGGPAGPIESTTRGSAPRSFPRRIALILSRSAAREPAFEGEREPRDPNPCRGFLVDCLRVLGGGLATPRQWSSARARWPSEWAIPVVLAARRPKAR